MADLMTNPKKSHPSVVFFHKYHPESTTLILTTRATDNGYRTSYLPDSIGSRQGNGIAPCLERYLKSK